MTLNELIKELQEVKKDCPKAGGRPVHVTRGNGKRTHRDHSIVSAGWTTLLHDGGRAEAFLRIDFDGERY